MKRTLLCGILCLALLLGGCASSVQAPSDRPTLPPAAVSYAAPTGDNEIRRSVSALLYLPDADGISLIPVETAVSLNPFRWYAQELVEALFAYDGTGAQRLPGADSLSLNPVNPVEVSCGIATVNLSASALSISHEDLYTVFQAITNTLCQFGDIRGVNLLIGGAQPGIDVAGQSPAGTLRQNVSDDLATVWARAESIRDASAAGKKVTCTATLYFPAYAGMGVLAEARALVFPNASASRMARTLLEALSEGPRSVHALSAPYLLESLATLPAVNEKSGERTLTLRFRSDLPERLQESGIPLSCMAASLCCTMTTFLPGINGVEIYIGTEKLTSLTQEATYQGAGSDLTFASGIMRRAQFAVYMLGECTLYFGTEKGLCPVRRAVPWYETLSPRFLLQQLCQGPRYYDSVTGLTGVLPDTLGDSDLMGVSLSQKNGVLLLNFSAAVLDAAEKAEPSDRLRMIYAMVNSLCENRRIREVCFFFDGAQAGAMADGTEMAGTFLPNPAMTAQ